MNGQVDKSARALLPVEVRNPSTGQLAQWDAWIDTGFTGDLVVPRRMLIALGLQPTSSATGILADGSQVVLDRYSCLIDWFGQLRPIEVIANDGAFPLLGVGLLIGHTLTIDYVAGTLNLV
jgi:clan AA aspartic protease